MVVQDLLLRYADEIEELLAAGKDLKDIRKWSYEEREKGRLVPYLSSVTDDCLQAAATKKQKELYAFFNETAPGFKMITKYVFRVSMCGVEFFTRGKVNGEHVTFDLRKNYAS